jgi:flagellar operon protein
MPNEFLDRIVGVPYTPGVRTPNQKSTLNTQHASFADVLRQVQQQGSTGGLKVSAHASTRISQRGVTMTAQDWMQVSHAVDRAEAKGCRDAYVVYGNTGFVVNVPNRTVVTAMVHQDYTIVTNIDSVVMIPRLDR